MNQIFNDCCEFCCVYIDDILVFSQSYETHRDHLYKVYNKFYEHGIVISEKKMIIAKTSIDFLGLQIDKGVIKTQPHISTKILDFPDKLEDTKELQKFLGLLNYARPFF